MSAQLFCPDTVFAAAPSASATSFAAAPNYLAINGLLEVWVLYFSHPNFR